MRLTTDVRRSNEMTQRDEHKKKKLSIRPWLSYGARIVAISSIQFLASSMWFASSVI